MASWPSDLPQEWFSPDSPPDFAPQDNTLRTPMQAGPAKLRRKCTAQPEIVTLGGKLTTEELGRLEDFVKDELGETKRFSWRNFRTGRDCEYRFQAGWASVKHKHDAGDMWAVTLTLEMMP